MPPLYIFGICLLKIMVPRFNLIIPDIFMALCPHVTPIHLPIADKVFSNRVA